jgi:enoyl-CoA hydratase
MYYGLKKAVEIVNGFAEQTALIITGTGDVFAPGGDMRSKMPDSHALVEQLHWTDIVPFEAVRNSTAPIVAAVNGICQGGGLLISVLADVAVASERATFRSPELLRGVADSACAAYIAPHVGLARARDLLFTARTIDAYEAKAMGLIARVVAHDALRDSAIEVAEAMLRTAPEARIQVKRMINERYGRLDLATMDRSLYHGPEAREGFDAFVEKREPSWVPPALRRTERS